MVIVSSAFMSSRHVRTMRSVSLDGWALGDGGRARGDACWPAGMRWERQGDYCPFGCRLPSSSRIRRDLSYLKIGSPARRSTGGRSGALVFSARLLPERLLPERLARSAVEESGDLSPWRVISPSRWFALGEDRPAIRSGEAIPGASAWGGSSCRWRRGSNPCGPRPPSA